MIKRILRAATGVIFFFVFINFLLVSALKFRLLSPTFWKSSLDKGSVYIVMQDKMGEFRVQMEESLKKEAKGRPVPKEIRNLLLTTEALTAERFKELVETNLDRILGYLNSKDQNLVLFLPVKEWKLPVASLGQSALSLTGQSSPEQVMKAMGYKPEESKAILQGLEQSKIIFGYLPVVWLSLMLLTVLLLVGHFFLGVGLADRVSGTVWLMMISGFLAKIIGIGAKSFFEFFAANANPPLPVWGVDLGRGLIEQFFNLGATVGLVVGAFGLTGVVMATYLSKQEKFKAEKEIISRKKKVLAFLLGVILGFVVLAVTMVAAVTAIGGKIDITAGGGDLRENLKV